MLKSIIVVVTYFFERFLNIFVQTWFQSCTPEYTNSLAFFPVNFQHGWKIIQIPITNPMTEINFLFIIIIIMIRYTRQGFDCASVIIVSTLFNQ